jgi:hypothetical protein
MQLFAVAGVALALSAPVCAADICDGVVQRSVGTGEAQGLGVQMIEIVPVAGNQPTDLPPGPVCIAFIGDEITKQILATCPIGSHCHLEGYVPGDDGILSIERIRRTSK